MSAANSALARNVSLYPWHNFCRNLLFWQATWFLYFQNELSAAQAILLYAIYDVSVTVLEVPSGYMSDRLGRRLTLILSGGAFVVGMALLTIGGSFAVFVAGQMFLGMAMAFNSGTDTALLYQSLVGQGRSHDMEAQSLRAWRFGFAGLATSAALGGVMALWAGRLPFVASVLAMIVLLLIALRFAEPPQDKPRVTGERQRLLQFARAFRQPALVWLFGLGVLMYGYSHIPFVFGQPFISATLEGIGWQTEAPVVSGLVTTAMMLTSLTVSFMAPSLKARIGLAALLLLAFGIQVGLAAALALSGSVFAIALLLLRMVPDSLSTPFILARIQPMIEDDTRATFLSLKSFGGKLLFAGSLWLAAASAAGVGQMPLPQLQIILGWYAGIGVIFFAVLAFAALRIRIDEA